MRFVRYVALVAALFGLVTSMGYVACGPTGPADDGRAARVEFDRPKPAAPFSLRRLDGTTIDSDELRGDIVVLDFWATWCGPCITEIPHYNELHSDYEGRGVHLIGVTLQSGSVEDVREFADDERHVIRYPLVMGDDEIVEGYGPIWGFPTTMLVGPDWQVRKTWMGASPNKTAQIRVLIDRILEQREAEATAAVTETE